MSKKLCCRWHDHLPEMFDSDATPEDSFDECGMAGMGTPSVCCTKCPMAAWYTDGSRNLDKIYFVKEIMSLPREQRP